MRKFDIDLIRTFNIDNYFTWNSLVHARYRNRFNY